MILQTSNNRIKMLFVFTYNMYTYIYNVYDLLYMFLFLSVHLNLKDFSHKSKKIPSAYDIQHFIDFKEILNRKRW